jgi:hypothetical protein
MRRNSQTSAGPHFSFFLYMASIRWVTRKPPKMLTDASTSATNPKPGRPAGQRSTNGQKRADDDDRGNRIRDRHQAACAARASPTRPHSSPRRSPARRSPNGKRTGRSLRRLRHGRPPPRHHRQGPAFSAAVRTALTACSRFSRAVSSAEPCHHAAPLLIHHQMRDG